MKNIFNEATQGRATSNSTFTKTVKPFLTKKACMTNNSTSIDEDGNIIRDKKLLVKSFSKNYINFVETSSGIKRTSL